MRVAVTGSSGILGFALKQVLHDQDVVWLTRSDFDITDLDKTLSRIKEIKPDYLIHAAAFTDVDGCEIDPERAYLVNGTGTRNVVSACEAINCPVIYISTDYVFDGRKKEPYSEHDKPNPVNIYGLSKLEGENSVQMLTNKFYIVRTSGLFGRNGKNFVDTIVRLLAEKKDIDVVNDQISSPTYAYDFAGKLKALIGREYGIYHITNTSACSWYEFTVEIARLKKVNARINPVSSEKLNRPAKRPAFSVLGNDMLKLEGIETLRHWNQGLKAYLESK